MNKFDIKRFGVYVWTSNQLMHCTPAWAYLFNKFWPWKQDVKILGYEKPNFQLPKNFEYISLGKQRGPKFWSNDMIDFFANVDNDIFYLTTEDGFIISDVNKDIVDLAIKIAYLNPNDSFSKFCLTADVHRRPNNIVKKFSDYNLIKATQNSLYRQSLTHSIWRKDSFLNKLIPNQSPWDFELDNKRAMNDGLDVYATENRYALHVGHGYKKGKKVKNWYENAFFDIDHTKYPMYEKHSGLSKNDIDFIEKSGWMPEI